MNLTLLHTAEVHRKTFGELAAQIAPSVTLIHHVREDWLERAQGGIDDVLKEEIFEMLDGAEGAVICTCTSLGPVAARAGAIRVDQPMMAKAAAIGGKVLLVFCLESTRIPSTQLLQSEIDLIGKAEITPLFLGEFWPLFMAGETDAFVAAIASEIREEVRGHEDIASVVLATVSMAGAANLLTDVDVPIFTSPELALRAGLSDFLLEKEGPGDRDYERNANRGV